MARRNAKKTVANVVVPESIVIETPIDFHNQFSSWNTQESADTTDTALPMGENGNVLVDSLEEFGPVLETPADEIMAALEAEIETQELAAEEPIVTVITNEPSAPVEDFAAVLKAIPDEDAEAKARRVSLAIDDRETFERSSNPDNENIHRTLKKVRSAFFTKAAARVLIATATDEGFINRSVHEGKRYNVYALGKAADIMKAAVDGVMSNAINIACMKSLFAMRAAGKTFTLETAKACASKNYACDAAIRQHLVRHTVSTSTAPTQASSTMQALCTLGVVKSSGSAKNPVYELTDKPIVEKLRQVLAA